MSDLTEYRVRWEIDLTANTPEEAARMALAYQRNPESIATSFDVYAKDHVGWRKGAPVTVDLEGTE